MGIMTFGSNRLYWMHFIFSGQAFNLFEKFTVTTAVNQYLQIKTPATGVIHITDISIIPNGEEITINAIEAPTVTDGTTAVTPNNMDRRSAQTALGTFGISVFNNPTAVSGGTIIESLYLPGIAGTAQTSKGGGQGKGLSERVLKPNTDYILEIINNGATTSDVQLNIFLYWSSN